MNIENKKKVLIISMSGGFGHIRAGEALLDYAKENLPNVHAEHINISDIDLPLKKYASAYEAIVKKIPVAWRLIYNYPVAFSLSKKMIGLRGLVKNEAKNLIRERNPDIIIFTNAIILPIFAEYVKKNFSNIVMALIVTDYHGHPYYVFSQIDYYFVPHEKVKQELEKLGVENKKIVVSGIPINPRFYIKQDVKELKQKYGISNDLPIVLFIASFKISKKDLNNAVKQLLEFEPKIHLVFIANGNNRFYNLIKKSFASHERLSLINWTNLIEEYIKISNVVVSKAGGLTVSECLAIKKPIIMVNPIPGQEEHNAEFVESNNLGRRVKNIDEIVKVLPEFISKTENNNLLPSENPCEKIFSALGLLHSK